MYDERCLQNIGSNIRFMRSACQISQQELAERIGISQTHLSNIEHGRAGTNMKLLLRVANTLHCRLDDFLQPSAAFQAVEYGID